jgi:hypothetical protein
MPEMYDTNVYPHTLLVPFLQNVEILLCRWVLTAKFVRPAAPPTVACCHSRRVGEPACALTP